MSWEWQPIVIVFLILQSCEVFYSIFARELKVWHVLEFDWLQISWSLMLKDRWTALWLDAVKLDFNELLNKEQIGNSGPFPVTNLPVTW